MSASAPRDSVIAVIGEGFGSLIVHTTARYVGFDNSEITVFGPNDNPVGTYQQFAYNLGRIAAPHKHHLTDLEAILESWVVWWIAIWTKVVILPLISLSWIENAGEFRSTDWSVAPEYVPLPINVFTPPALASGPPPLARQFSAAVIEIPEEPRRAPSPSGVHRIPTGPPPD